MKKNSFKNVNSAVIWNTNKEGGWKKYLDLTENSKPLEDIADNMNELDSEEMMTRMSQRTEQIKFQCFGKVTKKTQSIATDKSLSKLYEDRMEN